MLRVETGKIGIIIHPVTRDLLFELEPGFGRFPIEVTKKILEWTMPFNVSSIEGIQSLLTRETIKGDLIMFPLLMEQLTNLKPQTAVNKLVKAVRLSHENGAKLTCLVAYMAMIGKRGAKIQEKINVPLTNGLNLTSATLPLAVKKAAQEINCEIKKANIMIWGCSPIVYMFLKSLGDTAAGCYLYHKKRDILETYYSALPEHIRAKTTVLRHPTRSILADMNIVINATGDIPAAFDERLLKSGAIVLDMSYPRAISIRRKDILLIDGVALIPPGNPRFKLNFGLPPGLCFPCMAEPMVLAFEKTFTSYSLGRNVYADRAEHIFELAKKHGFRIGPLTSYEQVIPDEKIKSVLSNRKT
ncbi:MAG: hypothetical protein PHG69_05325 [Candidatus Omnitrophica bacterium]|nr:hypothetical protein [Candidatus Omnitrophota bacterium]